MGKYFISFDLETTGLDKSKDQIIQIAANKYDYENFEIVDQLNIYVQPMGSYTIGLGAYFKHNIKPEFLQDKPYLKDVAQINKIRPDHILFHIIHLSIYQQRHCAPSGF